MSNAHRMGLPAPTAGPRHRRRDEVERHQAGRPRHVRGAAPGEDARADDADDPEQQDAARPRPAALRLPDRPLARRPSAGLPAAPTEHGRLLRPRQVRAGVPRDLDVRLRPDPRSTRRATANRSPPSTRSTTTSTAILAEEGFTGGGSVGLGGAGQPCSLRSGRAAAGAAPARRRRAAHRRAADVRVPRPAGRPVAGRRCADGPIVAVLVLGRGPAGLHGRPERRRRRARRRPDVNVGRSPRPTLKPIAIAGGAELRPSSAGFWRRESRTWCRSAFDGKPNHRVADAELLRPARGAEARRRPDPRSRPGAAGARRSHVRQDSTPTDIELRAAPPEATTAPTASADDYSPVAET